MDPQRQINDSGSHDQRKDYEIKSNGPESNSGILEQENEIEIAIECNTAFVVHPINEQPPLEYTRKSIWAVISLKNKDSVNSVPHTCYHMNGKVGPVKVRHYSYFVGNQLKLKHNHTIEPFTARQI